MGKPKFWSVGLGLVFCLVLGHRSAATAPQAQSGGAPPAGAKATTLSGVYSAAQATKGEETYLNVCVSCHPPGTYKGGMFKATWDGRSLGEFFDSISERMPKNEPGSLSLEEYAQVIAYILKVNDMPAGKAAMSADSTQLKDIRIEFGK